MTKTPWTILHVSDFHLADPDGKSEVLRRDHFQEYIRDLGQAMKAKQIEKVDCLSITGDFVEQGIVGNFDAVSEIVRALADEVQLEPKDIVVCPGNHDLVRAAEGAGNSEGAREAYRKFAGQWGNRHAIKTMANGRAALHKLGDDLWVLSLDTTLGGSAPDFGPGVWVKGESDDEPLRWIKEHLKKPDELLVVLSHYPVEDLPGTVFQDEEEHFHTRHIWTQGKQMAVRIAKWRGAIPARTIWLSGDIHVPYRISANGIAFVTAGRFGCRPGKATPQLRQAKVIRLPRDSSFARVTTFSYEMPGNVDRPGGGNWEAKDDQIAVAGSRGERSTHPEGTAKGRPIQKPTLAPTVSIVGGVETVDIEVESQVIETIRQSRLLTLGRFESHENEVALCWVRIGQLMNSGGLFAGAIGSMESWLRRRLDVFLVGGALRDVLLIGIDCWGAIIASQLSVRTGANNSCIASRGGGLPYTLHERISSRVLRHVRKARCIVMIQDVVGSGASLLQIHSEITAKLDKVDAQQISWYALSLICDSARDRSANCGFLTAHGTVCGRLRMPSIAAGALPSQEICPPLVTFHRFEPGR